MIQIEEKEIVKGIDEAYKKAGSNAYFGNGFQAGVDFALKQVENLTIPDVVGQSEQLSLSDFRVGFEYEELQMDSERYLNKGVIWVKKTYGLNSPRLHKIQKLLDEGKLRKA